VTSLKQVRKLFGRERHAWHRRHGRRLLKRRWRGHFFHVFALVVHFMSCRHFSSKNCECDAR
jgi:hypothetical protein